MMKDWKKLPAYKAEPRIDSLVGYYLASILSENLRVEIKGIIPEFPLRLGTLKPEHEGTNYSDRSYKVDFFAVGNNGKNYLIEFKTDTGSRRDGQDLYLQEAKGFGTRAIVDGVIKISNVSTYVKKYDHLKDKMQELGILDAQFNYSGENPVLEIIYVQPSNKTMGSNVITFDDIANWLDSNPQRDSFEIAFIDALRTWSKD